MGAPGSTEIIGAMTLSMIGVAIAFLKPVTSVLPETKRSLESACASTVCEKAALMYRRIPRRLRDLLALQYHLKGIRLEI